MRTALTAFVPSSVATPELAWLAPFLAPALPRAWLPIVEMGTDNGRGWKARQGAPAGLMVMLSGAHHFSLNQWLH